MGKRKKASNKTQQSTCTKNVVKLQDTSPAQVHSGKASENSNTKTRQNVSGGTSLESLTTAKMATLSDLTPMAKSHTQNDPLHVDSAELLHDVMHRNQKVLSSPSLMDLYPTEQNADQTSTKTEGNTVPIQKISLSSSTSETHLLEMRTTYISAEAEPTTEALPHLLVQEKETVASTQKSVHRNLDSNSASKSGTLPANITLKEITSQPVDFIKTSPLKSMSIESTETPASGVSTDMSQTSPTCSGCLMQKSTSSFSQVVELGKEVSVLSLVTKAVQCHANIEEPDNGTNILWSTEKSSTPSHVDKFTGSGKEVLVHSSTTNAGAKEVPVTFSMAEKETLPVVKDYTMEKRQICVEGGNSEMPSKATKAKRTKQHAILDASISKISLSPLSEPLESTTQHIMTGPSKGPYASVKRTEIQKTSPNGTTGQGPANILDVVQEFTVKKGGESSYKTKNMHKIGNILSDISEEIPTKTSKPSAHNTTSCKENRNNKNGQNPDIKLNVEKDNELRNNLLQVTDKSRSKRKSKSTDKTLDSKKKQQENKRTHASHICVSNQLSKSEDYKVTIHENETLVAQKLQKKASTVTNNANEKLKNIKADGKNNITILNSEESCNKAGKKKRKSVKNEGAQIDISPESSGKLKQNCYTESSMQDFTNSPTNKNNSISCNKNEDHKSGNTQNSNTDSVPPVNGNNEAINDHEQQKKKTYWRNMGKKTAKEGNETLLRENDNVTSESCGHTEEIIQSHMHPMTIQGKEKQNKNAKPEDTSKTMLIRKGHIETESGESIKANQKVSAALSKEQLAHLMTTAVHLSQSFENSQSYEINLTPNIKNSLLAPKPTNIVSTADDEVELEYQLVQRHVFLSHVCHVCKSLESSNCNLKKCSNCKMISYCSKKHQREHWSAHKDLCKVISKVCKRDRITNLFEKAVGISPDEYRYYRCHYVNECTKELGRELDLWEKEMIYYPQVCHTCYESDIQKLTTCQKCHHVSYCQPSHLKNDHDIWCKEFQVYHDITIYQCLHGIIQPSIPHRMLQQYAPLTGDMETFMLNMTVSKKLSRLNFVALTDIATCPLTVLFSLQNSNFPLEEMKSLTIHLVGAEIQFEIDTVRKWELLLLHLIPNLSTLQVVFIGPELKLDSALIQILGQDKTCRECNTAGKKVIYEFWQGLYHDFLKSEKYQKPDLISAFNAGLYRITDFEGKDTWSPSIKAMLKEPGIPVVITEYTEQELPLDLQRIQSIVDSLEIIMSPARNPFASSKPSLNFLSEEVVPVIFKNFYITILKRGKM
jgi:splicing suppressor protein 51